MKTGKLLLTLAYHATASLFLSLYITDPITDFPSLYRPAYRTSLVRLFHYKLMIDLFFQFIYM